MRLEQTNGAACARRRTNVAAIFAGGALDALARFLHGVITRPAPETHVRQFEASRTGGSTARRKVECHAGLGGPKGCRQCVTACFNARHGYGPVKRANKVDPLSCVEAVKAHVDEAVRTRADNPLAAEIC